MVYVRTLNPLQAAPFLGRGGANYKRKLAGHEPVGESKSRVSQQANSFMVLFLTFLNDVL